MEFAERDIDHVLIGPGGVWAIETKTSMVPMRLTGNGIAVFSGDACAQARIGARKIGLLLRSEDVDVEVRPCLVLWGPGAPRLDGGWIQIDSDRGPVLVIEGSQLKRVLGQFTVNEIDRETAMRAQQVVRTFVTKRVTHQST